MIKKSPTDTACGTCDKYQVWAQSGGQVQRRGVRADSPNLGLHELGSFHNFHWHWHWHTGFGERSMENSPHLAFLEKADIKFGLLSVETSVCHRVVHVKVICGTWLESDGDEGKFRCKETLT